MNPRILTLLNTLGCLILTGLVVAQWRKERSIHQELTSTQRQLAETLDVFKQESQRRVTLERDIAVLKEAMESSQKAAESTTRELTEKSSLANNQEIELTAARNQLTTWETAVKSRDERIQILQADLAATRKRLDEAIARLKKSESR